ncbi:nicotinate-nucleotide diphosphorylase (carboxylating) [Thecamonas trahens ATCC 50062]|uniref:Nicotinate-nucleotide pyrophosphorylase [carboxylating] n=1 Tax=Thecamonas trahens ATCC 50062 TaxID=461836 RepID=A0A0L0DCE1_THETB|nr:nicotinate-nucleotide diphosphorylase (carboxylating) [Thecamonas trahens ATCC 50062]KNC49905.1 nicotinate-nucleotide diphosphorylase (carboxylating) [Thecamonas trahens ATCC 50062]|eukprot:XP_013757386.1 nicotinate-nucleotide diphosphorylase (carboxylating) [Thecamonas trahens ATCC 50062]
MENQPRDYACFLPPRLDALVDAWLDEDIPSTDYGGFVVGSRPAVAHLLVKSAGVLAGVPFADAVLARLGCSAEWAYADGAMFDGEGKVVVAVVTGPTHRVLQAERTVLNVLARCSGIATAARAFADKAAAAGFGGTVAGTRKTTPGFRDVEKYGMLVGGVDTHRTDLSSMVMLKDNHIWATGSITAAVETCRSVAGFSVKIEVETSSYDDAAEAINAGADVIMLDNFEPTELKAVAARLKADFAGSAQKFLLEASGGVRLDTVDGYFCDAIDIISTSSLHQGVGVVDFSLKIQPGAAEQE